MKGAVRDSARNPVNAFGASGKRLPRAVVLLCLAGACISAYLWSAKAGGAPLICGEFGECSTVNASPWSELFGLPVAAYGFVTYATLGSLAYFTRKDPANALPSLAGLALASVAALYSLYLTAIEAFVLHAYCVWCLVTWVIITTVALLWIGHVWRTAPAGAVPPRAPRRAGKAERKRRRRG